MPVAGIAWTIVALMGLRALLLYFAWDDVETIPMQWGLNGQPTWFAARGVALGFMPALAVCMLTAIELAAGVRDPGPRLLETAVLLFAVQALHLYLARRHVWR